MSIWPRAILSALVAIAVAVAPVGVAWAGSAAHRGMAITTAAVPDVYQRGDVVARRIVDLDAVALGLGLLAGDRRAGVLRTASAMVERITAQGG